MPPQERTPNEVAQQVMPLILLGTGLMASNRYFMVLDGEALALQSATRSVRTISSSFWSGGVPRAYFPLFDYLLHFWLRLTSGNFEWFRLLPVLLFLGGIFFLARAARRWGGPVTALILVWLSVFWPFGFNRGRVATHDALAFFLVGALTLALLRYAERPVWGRWAMLLVAGGLLLATQFFGMAIVALIGVDLWLRRSRSEHPLPASPLLVLNLSWFAVWLLFYGAFRNEISATVNLHQGPAVILAGAAFEVYTLFVSESVAPWHLALGIPAAIAVVCCAALICWQTSRPVRRLLIYSGLVILLMALTNMLAPDRLMLAAPWVLLALGAAIGAMDSQLARRALAATLLVIAGIAWYGVISRVNYSEPAFHEPWPQIADQAAGRIREGGTVISNSPGFFFYLTYALRAPMGGPSWDITGLLPEQIRNPHAQSPEQWLAAGHPLAPIMVWVRGMPGVGSPEPILAAARELDQSCGARTSRLTARDEGYKWKHWLFPHREESPWRIQIHEYDCTANSQEILHIPLQ